MAVYLAGASLEKVSSVEGPLGIPREKVNSKGEVTGVVYDDILLNLEYGFNRSEERPLEILLGRSTDYMENVMSVTVDPSYEGLADIVIPEEWAGRVFVPCKLSDYLEGSYDFYAKGIVSLVYVDEKYDDLKTLLDIGNMYKSVRFTGGRFLMVDGLKVGRFEDGSIKSIKGTSPTGVAHGIYDAFTEVRFEDLTGVVEKPRKIKKTPTRKPRPVSDNVVKEPRVVAPKKATIKTLQKTSSLVSAISAEDF